MKWMSCKTALAISAICVVLCAAKPGWSQARQYQFEQFPVKVYKGPIRIPKWVHKEKDGEWAYFTDRSAFPPHVSFAGEYDLDGITCGTGCHFYKMTNLYTGVNIPEIDMFDAGDPLPNTKDGHPYLTMLYYKPDSRLLIAEYHLDFDDPDKPETCRQRYLVLENGKLRPISKTFQFCTEEQERRQ